MIFWKTEKQHRKDVEAEAAARAIKESTDEIRAQSKFVQDALDDFMLAMIEKKTEGQSK